MIEQNRTSQPAAPNVTSDTPVAPQRPHVWHRPTGDVDDPYAWMVDTTDPEFIAYLETEILDRGMDAQVSGCGCLKVCTAGPVMVLYPQGKWFGEVDEEKLDAILDALEDGEDTEEYEI